jgi:MtN3 and saliva related transmembrane protein
MPKELTPYLGALAAFLASLSYLPQVKKAWPRGSTGDLSLGMLLSLTMALAFGSRTASFRVIGSSSPQTR